MLLIKIIIGSIMVISCIFSLIINIDLENQNRNLKKLKNE